MGYLRINNFKILNNSIIFFAVLICLFPKISYSATLGDIEFTDKNGNSVDYVYINDTINILTSDTDLNVDTNAIDTVLVDIYNITFGDTDKITLFELNTDTENFSGTIPFSNNLSDSIANDGILYGTIGDTLRCVYSDPYQGPDTDTDEVYVIGKPNITIDFETLTAMTTGMTDYSGGSYDTVPGSKLLYVTSVENTGSGTAINSNVVYHIPQNTSFDSSVCNIKVDTGSGFVVQTADKDGDYADWNITNTDCVTIIFSELSPGEKWDVWIEFIIN